MVGGESEAREAGMPPSTIWIKYAEKLGVLGFLVELAGRVRL